jgi:hypothetical protein
VPATPRPVATLENAAMQTDFTETVNPPAVEQRDTRRPGPRPQTQRQRAPKRRWCRLVTPPHLDEAGEERPGLLELWVQGEQPVRRWVAPEPHDQGLPAFALVRVPGDATEAAGPTLHVVRNGACGSCECRGFLRRGHCRHQDALQALRRVGRLP